MKTEKVVLSFIAVLIGIVVAAGAFYLYESTKVVKPPPVKNTPPKTTAVPPTLAPSYLTIDTPQDEVVVDKKIVQMSGKTDGQAFVIVSTDDEDKVVTPATDGKFTTTINLSNGENKIEITAFAPTGEEVTTTRVVTFSTESF